MKIGDTFIQDGRTYKVIGENEAGLISKVITDEPKVEVTTEEAPTPKRRTRKVEGA